MVKLRPVPKLFCYIVVEEGLARAPRQYTKITEALP